MSEWRKSTLGELVVESGGSIQTGPFGSQLHAEDYVDHGTPSVMPANIGDNVIDPTDIAQVGRDDVERLARHQLMPGDIVYSRRGDVERRAYVREVNAGWLCGTGCLRVRFGMLAETDPRYISYALGAPWVREWIRQHAVGATMLNLNTKILGDVPLTVPSLVEQRAIAEVLGALDDKIEANRKLAATADELASSQFSAIVAGVPLSDLTYGEIASVGGGGTPRSKIAEYWGGEICWLTPTDVTALPGPYVWNAKRTITDAGLTSISSPLYPQGTICMTSRATIGAFAVLERPMAVNQGFITVQPNDPDLRFWLLHEMRQRSREYLDFANGATFMELSRGNFKKIRVRLVDREAMVRFGRRAASLHDRARNALHEAESLAGIRDAVLPELMSGQWRVSDCAEVAAV